MSSEGIDWRDYQVAVAEFFRGQGCSAEVDKSVPGVRATHKVDVFVSFVRNGVVCRWVVECKLWNSRVRKEKVLTLKAIVEDVGADRGILFSESGFQSGALDAARKSNVTLVSSLEEFKQTASMGRDSINLVLTPCEEGNAPPAYKFPDGDQPESIFLSQGKLFVGNWGRGNVAIVRPMEKQIETIINLDRYERLDSATQRRAIHQYPPGQMTVADGKLFLGQVFSEFVLAIDIDTQSIVKRIAVPGGGEGAIASSPDGGTIYFASNRANQIFAVNTATYAVETFPFPQGGRGSMCILAHSTKPLLYIGIQRGGTVNGRSYVGGNCFLATFDLERKMYSGYIYLAEVQEDRSDDAIPIHLLFDPIQECLFVGMFQSRRGIYKINEQGSEILATRSFEPNQHNIHFQWVDPISQAFFGSKLLSINRNNLELVIMDRYSLLVEETHYLGSAPNGPRSVVVYGNQAIINYPHRGGLLFHELASAA
ncbi:MAG TPA: restriction endonuclease [Thermoguttaceae bacterium]